MLKICLFFAIFEPRDAYIKKTCTLQLSAYIFGKKWNLCKNRNLNLDEKPRIWVGNSSGTEIRILRIAWVRDYQKAQDLTILSEDLSPKSKS